MNSKRFLVFVLIYIFATFTILAAGLEKKVEREKNFILKLYKEGFYQEVIQGVENFENLYKKYMDEDIYLAKAESLYNTGDYKGAVESYKKCSELSKRYYRYSVYSMGYSYMELKNYIKAVAKFKELADSTGDYHEKSVLNTARIYSRLIQYGEAKEYYEKYLELVDVKDPGLLLEYYDVLFNVDKKEEAIKNIEEKVSEVGTGEVLIQYKEKLAEYTRKTENYDKALILYDELSKINKNNEYYYYKAIIYFNRSEYQKCIDEFDKIKDDELYKTEYVFYTGQCYYLTLDFDKAIEFFNKLTSSDRKDIKEKSWYFIATSYYQKKDYDNTIKTVNDSGIINENFLNLKRDSYISKGDYKNAITVIQSLVKENYTVYKNFFIAGQCYFNLGNLDRALANFELAEKKSDDEKTKISAIFEKAGIYMLKNMNTDAMKEYMKIPESSPLFIETRLKVIDLLRKLKKYEEIDGILKEFENKKIKTDYVKYIRAEIAWEKGDNEKAEKFLEGLNKKSDFYWKGILLKSKVYFNLEKYAEGKKLIASVLPNAVAEFKVELVYEFARFSYVLRDFDSVINNIEKILSENKDKSFKLNDEIKLILAEAYLKIKNFKQSQYNALFVAEESDDINYRVRGQYILGEINLVSGNYKQAVLEFLKCALIDNKNIFAAKAYFRSGECYQHLKRFEDAVRMYQKVIREYPDSGYKGKAEIRIDKIETDPVYEEI